MWFEDIYRMNFFFFFLGLEKFKKIIYRNFLK